jgi:aldehyde dehydrogenase (NAD+)
VTTTLTGAPERPMLIGGEWVAGVDGVWTEVVSPGRRSTVLARVPEGSAEDADRAVRAARAAFPAWRALHFKDRQKIILKIADALEDRAEELSALTAADTGNALRTQARPESQTLVNLFRYFGGVAGEFKGTVLPAGDDQLQYTRREPLGVVADDRRHEDAGRAGRGQHPGPQDRRGRTADHPADGRDRFRVPAAGCAERDHRPGCGRR